MSRRTVAGLLAAGLAVVLTIGAALVDVPYVTFKPGPTINVLGPFQEKQIIEISGHKVYRDKGGLRMVTVIPSGPDDHLSLVEVLAGWIDPDTAVLPKDAVYTASKGAVDAFTRGLSNEVAGQGVRVCAVRPGLTLTEIFESTLGQEGASELARRAVPMGRIGRPEEVAAMVLWLCSPEASYVTGFTYDVSGGR